MVKLSIHCLFALAQGDHCGNLRQNEPITRGPYLQALLGTSVEVHWRSKEPVRGKVECRLPGGAVRAAEEEAPDTVHRLKLEGLLPGAGHEYWLLHDGVRVTDPAFRFRTSPAAGEGPIRAVAIGDSGSGGPNQAAVAELIGALAPDILLHTGDLDYTANPDCSIFEPYLKLLPSMGFFPARGNHDLDLDWGDLFRPPNPGGPDRTYFSYDWGNAHFVALDTEIPFTLGSDQRTW
ncbi:MAG: metallophosphoesterase family protein, partial [Thermoanaerobaculia bacterium]